MALSTVALGLQALTLTAQVASVTAGASAAALAHRKNLARAVAKTKAKARLRRALVAVPVVGAGAAVAFEAQDFRDWQVDNPEGTFADYSCEVASLSAEVVDDVLQGLPEGVRPSREWMLRQVPDCAPAS
ncbi:MAG: hypothetical protein ACEPO2_18875 [Pelagibaca sp.]